MTMCSSESREVVQSILNDLLTGVCSSLADCLPESEDKSSPPFDLCCLCRERAGEFDLVNCFSLRSVGICVEVCQIKCLEQKASGYCGHYSLYFSLVLLRLCTVRDRDQTAHTLSLLTNGETFWRRYWENIRGLLSQVSAESWWPWTKEHVLSGDMERSYLKYLLSSELIHVADGWIHVLQYAYGLLQDPAEHVCAVQEAVSSFLKGEIHYLVFILGVTNHWVTLLAYRPHPGKVGVVYLDSNNEPVLLAQASHIDALVELREKKHYKRKGVGYDQWKKSILRQSLLDQRDVVVLLTKCLQGLQDLRCELVNSYWARLLSSYKAHVTCQVKDGDLYTVMLLSWFEACYSVNVIRDLYVGTLVSLGAHTLNTEVRCELETWVKECRSIQTCGLQEVNDFLCEIKKLAFLLKTV